MKAWILSLITKAGIKLSGPVGWLVSLILDRVLIWVGQGLKKLYSSVKEYFRRKQQEKVDHENEERYNQTVGEGSAPTQEELEDATSDLLNGRKR